jgi:hypothetical protein
VSETEAHSVAASDAFYEYPEISPEAPQLPDETDAPAGTDGGVPDPGETADGMTPSPVVSPDEPQQGFPADVITDPPLTDSDGRPLRIIEATPRVRLLIGAEEGS